MKAVHEQFAALIRRWDREARTLNRYGHPLEATILLRCRDRLPLEEWQKQIWERMSLRPMLVEIKRIACRWQEDADRLLKFGHAGQAATLERCAKRLRQTGRACHNQLAEDPDRPRRPS